MILPARATPEHRHSPKYHQWRIKIDRRDDMHKARRRSSKRECARAKDHDWDGPIQPNNVPSTFVFSYCRNCKEIRWS
jgi:hypothetical protein